MSSSKSGISQAESYAEIGDFWDNHSLAEFEEQSKPAEFEINIKTQKAYIPLDLDLSRKVRGIAQQRGVSAETLLNQWVQEKTAEILAVSTAE